jgi:hypothetical protein
MKEIILKDYMQNIYFGFDEFVFKKKKVLWIKITITIKACVAINTSKKIKLYNECYM